MEVFFVCGGRSNIYLSGNKYSSCWCRIRNTILTFCRCCLIVSFCSSILLGRPRKKRVNLNSLKEKTLSVSGVALLNNEDIILYLKIISALFKNNADIILNISILLSCILLYINIPKVISIIMKNKIDEEERINIWNKKFKYFFSFFLSFIIFLLLWLFISWS